MPKQDKAATLEAVKESLNGANGVVVANFKGLTVLELETLRKKVAKEGATAKVVKNTLLELAFKAENINGLDPYLKENTVLFATKKDPMAFLKVLADFAKENEKFVIKGGFVDGQAMDKAGVVEMAKIPSRKDLFAMIAGGLNGVLSTFLATIEALEKKKSEN